MATEAEQISASDPAAEPEPASGKSDAGKSKSKDAQPEQAEAAGPEAKIADLEDKLARAHAEAANTVKRTRDEARRMVEHAVEDVARRFLDVADNLERALAARSRDSSANADSVIEGVALTLSGMQAALASLGIEAIEPAAGSRPDPNLHQTIMLEASASVDPGCIVRTVQKGYRMRQRLLREAKVIAAEQHKDEQPAAQGAAGAQNKESAS